MKQKSNLQPRFIRFSIIFETINDKNHSTSSVERFSFGCAPKEIRTHPNYMQIFLHSSQIDLRLNNNLVGFSR